MPAARWNQVARLLGFLRQRSGQGAGVGDGQLLERFVQERDESAFELLLWRHGAMVLNVCRRLVPREEDAEDAFQATFLALVRKARSIRRHDGLAGWLYRVAYRAALAARARSVRIARHEQPSALPEVCAAAEASWNDLRPILDDELSRLPERYRLPLILCYLEGKTNEEAARELGCPTGTVFSRLSKGRALLRTRLVRRGLTLSATSLAALLSESVVSAGPVPTLVTATLTAGLSIAAGQSGVVSTQIASLTEGVLKAMFLKKLKVVVGVFVVLAFLAAGGGGLLYHALSAGQPEQVQLNPPPIKPPPEKDRDQKAGPDKLATVTPKAGGLERISEQSATIVAFESVEVVPQVSGILKSVPADIGSRVRKGDLLALIDSPDVVKDLELAKIALELARAKIEQEEAKVETAKTEVLAAEATIKARQAELVSSQANQQFRKKVVERMKQLHANKAVAREEIDAELAKYETALANTAAAEAALENAKAEKNQKLSRVRLAQTALRLEQLHVRTAQVGVDKAELLVNQTRLTAPFDGMITERNLATGDVVSPRNPRPVVRIVRTDKMRMIITVSEDEAVLVHAGMPVELTIPALGERKIPGLTVSRTASFLDRKTATMRVEVDVPNPKSLLMEGMFGRATIKLGTNPKALVIPRSCLVDKTMEGSWVAKGVYVIKEGKARFVSVTLGFSRGDRIEVLSGLNADDEVVLRPAGLNDGDAVRTKTSR